MSGDRLAHIEAQARDFHDTEFLGEHGLPAGVLYDCASALADDVLALVEIAKAARPFVEEYDFHAADYLADMVDGEEARVITARTVALLIEHQRALRSALARLDSGATEGDA